MEFYDRLFQAIKKDDLKEFKGCMETNYCGSLRLGRFPVLSVMYLYKSRRLLRTYEKKFLKHNSWQDVGEPMEIGAKFREVAGKCLRIYLNETVSPLEMLLLLDKNFKLKRVFADAHITAPVKQRLKDIYYIKWGLQAEFVRNKIVLQRRPMTRAEKLKWVMGTVCVVLCVVLAVGTPFTINAFSPFITDKAGVLNVSKWEQIKFGSDKVYALKEDVTIPENYFVEELNCELRGNGHTVTVKGNGVFGDINGKLTDIVFETNGYAVANNVNASAEVVKVTVNASVNMQTEEGRGFFANSNYGKITGVVVNVTGSLSATVTEQTTEDTGSYKCGGIVAVNNKTKLSEDKYNYALLQDCTVNFTDFSLKGQTQADAAFGGIVGTNDGNVEGCQTSGAISADTFDVAGICAENNYVLLKSKNGAGITQRTDVVGWNPLVAGVVLVNNYVVEQCENNGNISCTSTAVAATGHGSPYVYAAGIVYENYFNDDYTSLYGCVNNGNISASADYIGVAASGVCNFTNGGVELCANTGKISGNGTRIVEVAGIANIAYGYIYASINNGAISSESKYEGYVGGIVSRSTAQVLQCFSFGSIEVVSTDLCYVGGIMGYSDVSGSLTYAGTVQSCLADCEIDVTINAGSQARVGGIVGFTQEYRGGQIYALAKITNCYFTGKLLADGAYVGGIAGVVGENIYLASQSASQDKDKNFIGNVYVNGCGTSVAFGAALDADGHCVSVDDIGARAALQNEISSDTAYQGLLHVLASIKQHIANPKIT